MTGKGFPVMDKEQYERLIRLITFGSLPDVGKALENLAPITNWDSMSLEERRQACMDAVLRAGLEG